MGRYGEQMIMPYIIIHVTILLYLKLLIWSFRQDEYHYQRFSGVRSDECYELKSFTVEERENQTFCCKSETLQHHQSLRKMMTIEWLFSIHSKCITIKSPKFAKFAAKSVAKVVAKCFTKILQIFRNCFSKIV